VHRFRRNHRQVFNDNHAANFDIAYGPAVHDHDRDAFRTTDLEPC